MRNWHTKVIKLQEARSIITVNNYGDPDLYVGVIEGKIQYSKIVEEASQFENYNYKSPNTHLENGSLDDRKIIYRERVDGSYYDENLKSDANEVVTMTHTTSVAGIIAGNDIGDNVLGICPDVKIINAVDRSDINQFDVSLLLGLVNEYSKGNINSYYYDRNILKKNSVGGLIEGTGYFSRPSNIIPRSAKNPNNNLKEKATSVISCSYTLKGYDSSDSGKGNIPKKIADFILTELFTYGSDGRGILTVFSAGNVNTDIDSANSGSVFSPKTLIVAASKVTVHPNGMNLNDEGKALYSNYGKRIDICAPSCPVGKSAKEDIEIYAPTAINCGEIGNDDQIFITSVLHKSSDEELILAHKHDVIFAGQSIEIGDPLTIIHEVRFIKRVETSQFPANADPTANLRTKITLDQPLLFTKNTILQSDIRICIFKKNVERFSISKLKLDNLNGIGYNQSPLQKAYLYSEDPLDANDFSLGMTVTIKNLLASGNIIDVEEAIQLSRLTNLKLIPGEITAKLIANSPGSKLFKAKADSSLQGFFSGQQVFLKEEDVKRHLKFVSGTGGTARAQFSQLSSEPDSEGNFTTQEYTIRSRAYGNITSSFGGTSAAAPIVSGVVALLLTANKDLNAAEIKHILKTTAHHITTQSYNDAPSDADDYNYGYTIHKHFGAGRVDAEIAVKLARNWHCTETGTPLAYPEVPVIKPRLEIADRLNGTIIESVPITDPVDSPDIWVSELANSNSVQVAPFNRIDTSKKQYINVRVRNTGNRNSFIECDLRVFIAFTDETNPSFPFPGMWYDQSDVKLLAVKQIPITAPQSETIIQIEWQDIALKWNSDWNPIGENGKRKKTYILAHIAPFDGLFEMDGSTNPPSNLSLANIRNNKQLTCKEIIVTHNGVNDRTAFLSGNKLDITVGQELIEKTFDLSLENIPEADLATTKVKATKVNRVDQSEVSVFFSKNTNDDWEIEGGATVDWITFETPDEIVSQYDGYKYIKFPHTITVNSSSEEIKIETLNA